MKRNNKIIITMFLLIFLFSTISFVTETSALDGGTQLRPEWMKVGDYVMYQYTQTALGITENMHTKKTITHNGTSINDMLIEHFGEQLHPDFPLSHLQSGVSIALDPHFLISEDEILSIEPEIEEVRGLNNMTYLAYKVLQPEVWVLGELCECNSTYWYEKETLVKIKQLEWWFQEGIDVWSETIIEESNIPQLASPSQTTESAKIVTTTIFVNPPKTIITTTVTITATVTKLLSTNLTSLDPSFKAPPSDIGDGPVVTTTVTVQVVDAILPITTLVSGVVLIIVAGWIIIRKRR